MSIGIIGLPNVGKSTLFNALTNLSVDSSNYPFCTIEPNKGIVKVPDDNLDKINNIVNSANVVPAVVEFVDIAGLVKGASKGAGLGNQFLSHIREVAAIVHVIRQFQDSQVVHVEGRINPNSDIETIETELIIKDIATINKRIENLKQQKLSVQEYKDTLKWLEELESFLSEGQLATNFPESKEEDFQLLRKSLFLLTDKPFLYLLNTNDSNNNIDNLGIEQEKILTLNIKLEQELSELPADERSDYIDELGLQTSGINKLIQKCYSLLNLISFYTAGEKEVRAWTVKRGVSVEVAAGVIHSDFQKNFIAAEVVSLDDFIENGGWNGAREAGKIRLEGRGYSVQENDIIIFKHN
ncbi:redox-regulated ATPase YchF [Candidatus Dojkabacteria bacterium]|nr:redox-regulated ATPase YchF [Candidatus Dojkabacteria bacterium]